MYVDILSSALDDWVTDLSGPELIEYAVLCRDELRALAPPQSGSADSAYTALAAEIAYDRALIAICTEHGIYAHATTFAYPMEERKRIEALLVEEGVDLDSPQWRRRGAYPVVPDPHPGSAVAGQSRTDRDGSNQVASGRAPRRPGTRSSGVVLDESAASPRKDLRGSDESSGTGRSTRARILLACASLRPFILSFRCVDCCFGATRHLEFPQQSGHVVLDRMFS